MAHFKHYEEVGEVYLTLSKLQKETYVWEQILANRSKWTKAELQDSLNYINSIREEQYGLEILEIARKVLEDFRKGRYKEDDIEKVVFNPKKELYRGDNKGKPHPTWTAIIKAPFDNTDFLAISDETGKPLYYQNFTMIVYEIGKDAEGNYFRKEN